MFFPFYRPIFYLALGLIAAGLLVIAWRRELRWRPAWPLRFIFAGLVLVAVFLPQRSSIGDTPPGRAVLIVDQSASLSPDARGLARAQARQWLESGENRVVIAVGLDAQAVSGEIWPPVEDTATDLAGALGLAKDLLGDIPGQVYIASDGQAGDVLAAQRALAGLAVHEVSFIPLAGVNFPTDVYVGELFLPSAMWEDSPFTAVLPVYQLQAQEKTVSVQLYQNGLPVFDTEQTVVLQETSALLTFDLVTKSEEIMTFSAVVSAEGDPRPENNIAYASLRVYPAPRVLIVTQDAARANTFAQALAGTGLDADLMTPGDMPASLSGLDAYQVIVLHNFLANNLSEAQMNTLKDYVQQLGRGLIFLGGRNAYTLGGYKNTVLEPLLPVRLEPPPRDQNTPLTFVLAFDRSASMAPQRTSQNLRPITLAREAAIRAVENLGPEDFLGILTYNTNASWTIPLGIVGEGLALQRTKDAISQVNASGGTSIFKALNAAVTGLLETETTETRHLLLLSDGKSSDGSLEEFVELARFANEQGITISTIALGTEADNELMALIAEAGKGRYYPVEQAVDLPKILIDESQAARGENVHEGLVFMEQGEDNHPVLSGFLVASMPGLDGYNALESKSDLGAEDVLIAAGFEDPLLSVWQYGLGRVAAWTGDIGEEWGGAWSTWPDWGRFWSQVIRYALPDPALGPGQVEISAEPDRVTVTARLLSSAGVPRNAVTVQFSYVDGAGEVRAYPVPQAEPGIYRVSLPLPDAGVYRGVVQYLDDEGIPVEIAAPLVVNYPAEIRPLSGDAAQLLGGAAADGRVVEVISWDELVPQVPSISAAEPGTNELLQRLLFALLLLWPVEIAVRRRYMPWR